MEAIIILLTALLPIAVLVYYIYHKDKKSPEPSWQLVKAFVFLVFCHKMWRCGNKSIQEHLSRDNRI